MMRTVTLSSQKGVPKVEVFIGQANFGKYRLLLWDANGKNAQLFGKGINVDQVEDKFPIGTSVGDLDDRILSWEIIIAAFTGNPGQRYSASVSITQNGAQVQHGLFEYKGALEGGATLLFEHARLRVS